MTKPPVSSSGPPAPLELPPLDDGEVLVVDDEAYNRELLVDILKARGFATRTAEDGEAALAAVESSLPDTILLDVMMPGMDGFQVCRRLKGSTRTAHVPVLLVTALSERTDRISGIEAGADDFLQKPVDRAEALLRVRNAVFRKRLFDELEEKYRRLTQLEALREDLTRMLVHDMQSPLTAISTNLQLLEMSLGDDVDREVAGDLKHARMGVGILMDMLSMILDVSRSQELEVPLSPEEKDLREIVKKGIEPLRALADGHHVDVRLGQEPVPVRCDPDLVRRTVSNLFGNAVKFTPEGGAVIVRVEAEGEAARIEVEDTGPGIPRDEREQLFQTFSRFPRGEGRLRSGSTGLGLAFCKLAVEAHGGAIGVRSEPGEGSTFWFRLPFAAE